MERGYRNFRASAHLLRGVAKLRTTIRKTSSTVPQELTIGDVKVQVLHVADRIRKYAPFPSHANEAITNNKENEPIGIYTTCTLSEEISIKPPSKLAGTLRVVQ